MIMIETTIQHNRAQYNKANSQKKIYFIFLLKITYD